ncbi:anti-sigma factor domain-containing protein [Clostridiaceae bacterium 35-E11]
MIYKGCVVKVGENFAIVLTDTLEYLKVVKKDGLTIGKQIIFVKEDIYKEKQISLKHIGLIAAVFVMMIISTLSFGGFNGVSHGAVAVVSIDINPSIEFEIDKANKIIKVLSINQEAKELIDQDLLGMPVEKAIFTIVVKAKEKHYITQEKNSVLISTMVMNDDYSINQEQFEKEIEAQFKQDKAIESVQLIYVKAPKQDFKAAKKQKMSIGKYEIYKQEKEKNSQITIEQIKKMKVQEIVNQGIGKPHMQHIEDRKEQKHEEKIEQKKQKKEIQNKENKNKKKDSRNKENKMKEKISEEEVNTKEVRPLKSLEKEIEPQKDQDKEEKEKWDKGSKKNQKIDGEKQKNNNKKETFTENHGKLFKGQNKNNKK